MPTSVSASGSIGVWGFAGRAGEIPCTRHLVVADQGFFPTLVCYPDGELVSVLRGGDGHVGPKGRLDVVRSADGGVTWSDPVTIADSDADDRNPALGIAPDGALCLLYGECRSYDDQGRYFADSSRWRMIALRSEDRGHTWARAELPAELPGFVLCSPYGGGPILTRRDGTMLASIGVTVGGTDGPGAALVALSADCGRSWSLPYAPMMGSTEEVAFEELADGGILAVSRAGGIDSNALWALWSADDGATWSAPARVTPEAFHPGQVTTLPDDRLLLTFGCRRYPFGVRALLSADGGRTWDWGHELVLVDNCVGDKRSADCGYPTTVLLPDGHLFTTYYTTQSDPEYFPETGDRWIAAGIRWRLADLPPA